MNSQSCATIESQLMTGVEKREKRWCFQSGLPHLTDRIRIPSQLYLTYQAKLTIRELEEERRAKRKERKNARKSKRRAKYSSSDTESSDSEYERRRRRRREKERRRRYSDDESEEGSRKKRRKSREKSRSKSEIRSEAVSEVGSEVGEGEEWVEKGSRGLVPLVQNARPQEEEEEVGPRLPFDLSGKDRYKTQ